MSESSADGGEIVLLCECAGMMGNIDYGSVEAGLGPAANAPARHWCSRESHGR